MADARIEDPFGLVGTTLEGQYRIDQVVGEGGFGVVYRGWHAALEQPIAIKALKVLADDQAVQDALYAKFKDEAKLLYTLSQASLHIVRSMDFKAVTSPSGVWTPYMVLEWLAGRSLGDDLATRRKQGMRGRTIDEAFAILEPAAEGLAVAHDRRVAHRDIKPANLFLLEGTSGVRVKVLDFGIAKIIRDNEVPGTRSPFASFTWLYAAPEQLDPRVGQSGLATDVYAFALLLTELLTDRLPVEGRDVVSLLKAATDPTMRPTPRQRGATVPDAIEQVCRRALAVDPKARFATIGELWSALSAARRPLSNTSLPSSNVPATMPSANAGFAPGSDPALSSLAHTSGAPQTPQSPHSPPKPSSGPGVYIPQASAPAPMSPTYPSAPYASQPGPSGGMPMHGGHSGGPMMQHPSAMSPPRMMAPPGMAPYGQRRVAPAGGSALPVVLAVIGLVVGLMFVATCAAVHAAC